MPLQTERERERERDGGFKRFSVGWYGGDRIWRKGKLMHTHTHAFHSSQCAFLYALFGCWENLGNEKKNIQFMEQGKKLKF